MKTQSMALTGPHSLGSATHAEHHGSRRGLLPFASHFGQMTGAMMAGMFLLAALPDLSSSRDPELYGTLMAVSMTVPMVAWMRFRRHSWRLSSEMAAAMIVPTLVLLVLASLNLVSGRTMIGLQHGLMMPSMLGAMLYRRSEYGL